jgi:chemotaxis protein MotA
MELFSFLGVVIGFGALLFGTVLEGGDLHLILNPVAFLIVMGGTLGAVMVHTPTKVFLKSLGSFPRVFFPPKLQAGYVVKNFLLMARSYKKEGQLSVISYERKFQDPFIKKSLKMLMDGSSVSLMKDILNLDISLEERNQQLHSDFYKSLGGYSPTIGLVGAILGLINVMSNLGNPELLGHGLAVAFVSTLYGVAFANLVFLPVAEKLAILSESEAMFRDMIVTGIVSIREGESHAITEARMRSFLDERLSSGWK